MFIDILSYKLRNKTILDDKLFVIRLFLICFLIYFFSIFILIMWLNNQEE